MSNFSPIYIPNCPPDLKAAIEHLVTEEKRKHTLSGKKTRRPNFSNYIIGVLSKHVAEIKEKA